MSLSSSDQLSHLYVSHDEYIVSFRMTFVYAKSTRLERLALWDELRSLAPSIGDHPWLIGGDFNTIASLEEYIGRAAQDQHSMDDFNDCMADCDLSELPISGGFFTWMGVRSGGRVWKRLDRLLVNEQWNLSCTNGFVKHLNRATSDHSPLLLSFGGNNITGPRPFRFQSMWTRRKDFPSVVETNWNQPIEGFGMAKFCRKLQRLKGLEPQCVW